LPRFHFDVHDGLLFVPDEEGLELDGFDSAKREATEAVLEIGRDRLKSEDSRAVTIEVRDEHRRQVLTVTVSLEINRVDPVPRR
jgi:hypothetical protein